MASGKKTPPRFDSVDHYIESLDAPQSTTVRSVVDTTLGQFPELSAVISWNVPQLRRGDEYVLGVSVAKKHISLAPWSPYIIDDRRTDLEHAGYVVKANLFQVPNDWNVDAPLLHGLVTARLSELDTADSS